MNAPTQLSTRGRVLVIAGAVLSFIVSLGFVVELIRSRFVRGPVPANHLTLTFGATIAALVVGTLITLRRPNSSVGWLLMAAAATTGFSYYRFSTHPWAAAAGLLVFFASSLLPLHAAVAAGEGIGRFGTRVLAGAHALLCALAVVIVLTVPPGTINRWFVAADSVRHVDNVFQLWEARGVARAAYTAWWITLLSAALFAVVLRFVRWRRAPRRVRRTDGPAVVGATAWLFLLAASGALVFVVRMPGARAAVSDFAAVSLPAMALALLGGVVGWVELLEPRLARRGGAVEVGSLVSDRSGLREMLANLLATPRVEIAYATETGAPTAASGDAAWVDVDGRSIDLDHDRRARTVVQIGGRTVAAILHDLDVPADAVQLGARLTAAQLAAERATALSRARAEAVRTAAAELVRAGDRAARAVSADMRSGPIPELVGIAHRLRAEPDALSSSAEALGAVTARVREISHGLLPRELEENGLQAVLGGRAAIGRRLPAVVEVTVYLLTIDDPNAHARDDGAAIVVTRDRAPDAEAASRAAALGGTIDGTVVSVPVG